MRNKLGLLNKATGSVPVAALILGGSAVLSRFFGLIRDRILAGQFGAGVELDVYFAAFRIPDLIYSIIIGGAITSAFIPVFISQLTKDKEEAWNIARSFFYIALFGLLGINVAIYFLMPHLIPFVVPGFDAATQDVVIAMSRIMLLSPLFLGLSAVFSGILHSFRKFFVYSLAPIFYNIGIIIGALFFVPVIGINGLAWGVALGAFLHILIQAPVTFWSGFSLQKPRNIFHPDIPRIIRLMVPRALGLAAFQVNLLVITAIASTIASGALTIFNLANHIQYMPVGIIGVSYGAAVFPNLSDLISRKKPKEYLHELSRALRSVLYLVFPLGILFFILRAQIVRLVLGTGKFSWEDTQLTAAALGAFSIGIFAYALIPVISKAFYAKEDTKTPVIANSIGMGVNILLSVLLIYVIFPSDGLLEKLSRLLKVSGIEGVAVIGLPLAFSIGGMVALVLLFMAFFKDEKNYNFIKEILGSFIRVGVVSLVAGVVAWLMLRAFTTISATDTTLRVAAQSMFAGSVAGAVYLFLSYIFKFDEFNVIVSFARAKFTKKNKSRTAGPPDQLEDFYSE